MNKTAIECFFLPGLVFLMPACGGKGTEADGEDIEVPEARPDAWRCTSDSDMRCASGVLSYCEREGEFLMPRQRDCAAEDLVCVDNPPVGCVLCRPGGRKCEGQDIYECAEDGGAWGFVGTCHPGRGEACIDGYCTNGCENAAFWESNVGCEYWAADLDNAVTVIGDASAQQYAVVISNPSTVEAFVTVERNEAPPGEPERIAVAAETTVSPNDLDVILLDRREVDGSSATGRNDGTGSALTASTYRITSTAPIVAYQFNPLDNVRVFSNDASILIPTTACGKEYVVLGWPQTIADTDDPNTDMEGNLRAFLTIVGTDDDTQVNLHLPESDRLVVLGDGAGIPPMRGGDAFDVTLGPFEVLNLETDGFLADFTGTTISSSKPVVVFSGSEASDVPAWETLGTRRCCADHLEHQLYSSDRSGRQYVAGVTPYRTRAVKMAGGNVTLHDEYEYFKVLGLNDGTTVRTTLPTPDDVLNLDKGQSVVIETTIDFVATADKPISFGQFVASQQVTGIRNDLPGGDPAFIMVPPVEQWRDDYIFLTPSFYAFDFIIVAHSPSANILLDGAAFPPTCETTPVAGAEDSFEVTRCPLSFPQIVEGTPPDNILPGEQDDGVHEIVSDKAVGVVVYGFDNFVSYGYTAGTDLRIIQ